MDLGHTFLLSAIQLLWGFEAQCAPDGTGPFNTVVQDGDTAVLGCRFTYAESVDWYRGGTDWLTSGESVYPPALPWVHAVLHDPATNAYDLEISGVVTDDGEHYFCTFLDTEHGTPYQLYKYHARLVVLDGTISCVATHTTSGGGTSSLLSSLVTAGDIVTVTCSLQYGGPWAPRLLCSSDVFTGPAVTNATSGTARYTYEYTVPGGNATGQLTCTADFLDDIPADGVNDADGADYFYARNLPVISGEWSSGDVSIEYSPESIRIEPIKSSYVTDDVITCSANGNPEATITWYNTANGAVVSNTDTLVVVTDYDGITVQCIASNSVGSSTSSLLIGVEGAQESSTDPTYTPAKEGLTTVPGSLTSRRTLGTLPPNTRHQTTSATLPGTSTPESTTSTGRTTTDEQTDGQTTDEEEFPLWAIIVLSVTGAAMLGTIIGTTVYATKKDKNEYLESVT